MIAKALSNPALRDKFHVGDTVLVPRTVWTRLTQKMCNLPTVEHQIEEVGDRVIEHGKNRLCRFGILLGSGTTSLMKQKFIWEEWMLEKIEVLIKPDTTEACAIDGDETSLPPHN